MREGWHTVAVEDVARVVGGGTPRSTVPEFWGGDVQWLTPKDLAERPARYTTGGARTITQAGLERSGAKLLPPGAVLLTSRAPVGYVSVAAGPIATNQGFKSLVLDDTQLPEFWYYLLGHSTEYLRANSGGSTFQELSGASLKKLRFTVPPLVEQRRIVDLIGALDDTIAAAERSLAQMTEAHHKLRRHLFASLHTRDRALGDVATVQLGRMLSRARAEGAEQAPYIRNANIQWSGLDLSDLKTMSFPAKDRVKYALKAGDILVCEGGDPGRAVILDEDLDGIYYQKAVHRVRTNNEVMPQYLYHWIAEAYTNGNIADLSTVTTISHLTAEKFRLLRVPVPSRSDQEKLVTLMTTSLETQRTAAQQTSSLRDLRTNLLTALLSGEHEIPETYDEVLEDAA